MKKKLLLVLCLLLIVQCLPLSVLAGQTTSDPSQSATDQTLPTSPEIVFGTESILAGCRTIEGVVPLSGNERRLESAQGVMVFDVKTNTVVYSFNPDMKMSPGTLTKLVTALIAVETCDPEEVVVCHSRNISRLPGGSQNVKLRELEEMPVIDLVRCLLMHGANDAAVALSEHIAGNMQSFVEMMNNRVRQMGCTNTEFNNVHGLDNANQYSTARDMAKIYTEVMKNEILYEILGTTKYTVPATNSSEERALTTQNYHLAEDIVAKYYDKRVTGGLASYTNASGAAIVCSAENKHLSLVLVILGAKRVFAENGWLPTYYGNFDEMVNLLEFSFNGFKTSRIIYQGQALYQFPVTGGECDVVAQAKVNYDSVLPADCRFDNLIKNVKYNELVAPIKEGDLVGTISLSYRNSVVAEAELYAMCDVQKATGALSKANQDEEGTASAVLSVLVTICLVVLGLVAAYLIINALRRAYGRARRRRRRANRRRSW